MYLPANKLTGPLEPFQVLLWPGHWTVRLMVSQQPSRDHYRQTAVQQFVVLSSLSWEVIEAEMPDLDSNGLN